MVNILRARQWTEEELLEDGYRYHPRQKQLVMAARLPEAAAPLNIHYPLETVVADVGDIIVFDPSEGIKPLNDYQYWSVKPDVFKNTYRRWQEYGWTPTPAEKYLMQHNCSPYYKFRGVWAKQLQEPTYVESLESVKPQLVPAGVWIAIGAKGEPWHVDDKTFRARYVSD